ncbi:PBP1A family penicillin-binding protein [Sphingobium boeckii]|uniref:Penicillin-binding protein 1A n=1 Tax=Sphingobium boeckii TaxID=1082345 RepID=A0A7W9AGY9_9SPHN|nr:PBP1A family penicillin-binding protein [Sphingobium boeckii]MBB5685332.1 penicillin-binding protein 1A [Sphingobium boeckii]
MSFWRSKSAPEPALPGGVPAPEQWAFDPVTGEPIAPPAPPRWRIWARRAKWASLAMFVVFMLLVAWLAVTAPLSKSLKPIAPPSITLLSEQGKPIARKGAIIAAPVEVSKLPEHVPQAFMAIEDRRFYSHWGLDPRGLARAMWTNARAGGMRQGGSTITQQLAKVAFLNSDRTAARKLREVFIAFWLEAWLSKDEIMARYLSNVYFGDNVYGLRAASVHYFNRQPEKLTIAQAAMLAGLLKAPSRLAPTVNLKGAQERAELVTAAMVEAGFITEAEHRALRPARLDIRGISDVKSGTYFADWVLPEARDKAGAVYAEQEVTTTLDDRLQKMAENAAKRGGVGKAQVAIVVMKPNGQVVAMVGGKSYADSTFNRATQAKRQPGSTFKLFVYLAALRSGMTPDSMIDDSPVVFDTWEPKNYGGRYRGNITLKEAFAQSSNVAAVRLAHQVGIAKVIRAARDLGITSPLEDNLSVALGTSGVTLLELTSAYASVANEAYPVKAHGLPAGNSSWYDSLWDRQSGYGSRTLDDLRTLLAASVNGTGRAAALNSKTYGKTGTTQDSRDGLFVGYAGDLVTGVWVGNDDNSPIPGLTGGGIPAKIWRDFMSNALDEPAEAIAVEEDNASDEALDAENAALNMSIEGEIGGMNVGVQIGPEGVRINADPAPAPVPAPRPGDRVTPPPVVPRLEDDGPGAD